MQKVELTLVVDFGLLQQFTCKGAEFRPTTRHSLIFGVCWAVRWRGSQLCGRLEVAGWVSNVDGACLGKDGPHNSVISRGSPSSSRSCLKVRSR